MSAAVSSAAPIAWQREKVSLKACAGDLPLITLPLDLMVCTTHFSALPTKVCLRDLPPLDADCHGYLIWSFPADGTRLSRLWREQGRLFYAPRRYDRYWVALEGTFESYLKGLSAKTRSTLKRKRRKFEADAGGLDFRVYRTVEELTDFHGLARKISARSYQERLMDAGLPEKPAFLQDMQELAVADQVRGYLLFHQGEPVAYTYSPVEDGIVMYDHTGFDPTHRQLSPGTVLQFLILESLFAEGRFRLFDFTEGTGAHKALFGTHQQACMDLYILRYGFSAFGSVITQTLIERSTEILAKGLDHIGAKRRLKSLMRGI
ncbi:MAG: GNAT family N-acetyltransferase [Geminicoccaceae bacterium]